MRADHRTWRILMPGYSELSLFLIGISILLLLLINPVMRDEINMVTSGKNLPVLIPFCLLFFGQGLVFSFIHLFTDSRKNNYEKFCMLFFVIFANATSGFAALVYELKTEGYHPLIIFPVLNFLNGLMLMSAVIITLASGGDFEHMDSTIEDDNATLTQGIIGILGIASIIAICHYGFNLYWAMTLSICVVCIGQFDRLLKAASARLGGH